MVNNTTDLQLIDKQMNWWSFQEDVSYYVHIGGYV